jgi:hypothetical protein
MRNGFTPDEAFAILDANITTDTEELETYVYGPDDPADYFSKFADEKELIADFKEFLTGY